MSAYVCICYSFILFPIISNWFCLEARDSQSTFVQGKQHLVVLLRNITSLGRQAGELDVCHALRGQQLHCSEMICLLPGFVENSIWMFINLDKFGSCMIYYLHFIVMGWMWCHSVAGFFFSFPNWSL